MKEVLDSLGQIIGLSKKGDGSSLIITILKDGAPMIKQKKGIPVLNYKFKDLIKR